MGAGSLGKLVLQPPVDIDEGVKRFGIVDSAMNTVAQMGYLIPGLPASGYRGEMPPDITSLDDEQLGRLLAQKGEFIGSLRVAVAKAEGDRNVAESHLTFIRARVRIGLKAEAPVMGKMTDRDRSDFMESEPRVYDAVNRSIYYESVYKITRSLLETNEMEWETISRRISQRGQDVQRMVRSGNVAGVPVGAPTFRRRGT